MNLGEILKVDKMRLTKSEKSKVVAFVDILVADLMVVKGFRVVNGDRGLFVGMPREKNSQGKFFDVAYPIRNEAREELVKLVLDYYEANKDKTTVK